MNPKIATLLDHTPKAEVKKEGPLNSGLNITININPWINHMIKKVPDEVQDVQGV